MGLLDRWSKKKQEEILEKQSLAKTEEKPVKAEKTAPAKKTSAKTAKKTTKATAKKVSSEVVNTEEVKESKTAKIKNDILVRALVTEKSAVKQSESKYSFVVVNNANKAAVKKAVFEVYGVKPVAVNMLNVQGKFVRFGNHYGKRSDYKKAVVTLPKGKTIVVHEGV